MAKIKSIKIRMCVVCRGRFKQDLLLRLQVIDGKVADFCGFGRSFYLCENCLQSRHYEKTLQKHYKANTEEIAQIWQSKR